MAYHLGCEADVSDGLVRSDVDTMGGGDELATRLALRQSGQARRAEEASSRVQAVHAKEAQWMDDFKRKMGCSDGTKLARI